MNDTARNWNEQQAEIIEAMASGTDHVVVIARAGTGKTTTMLAGARRFPRGLDVAYLAFNNRNQKEVSGKVAKWTLAKGESAIDVRTFHSLGRGALYSAARAKGRTLPRDPDSGKQCDIIRAKWGDIASAGAMIQAASFCKNTLCNTPDGVAEIVARFDLDIGVSPRSASYDRALRVFCSNVVDLLREEIKAWHSRCVYNFDDMIWLPVVLKLRTKQFDRLIVDELQDLNACQHEIVEMAMRPRARVFGVGDDRQAIYSWRGAELDGIERFRARFGARVLRLPVTYRCGRAIVELAATAVPDYQAASSNAQGEIVHLNTEKMLDAAQPGDAILSRVNAPLVKLCLELWKRGKRAAIVGKDVGAGLVRLIGRAVEEGAASTPELVAWIEAWRESEIRRLESKDPPGDSERVRDDAECIIALSEGRANASAVRDAIRSLFVDENEENPEPRIVLSSTHKAKGLEWHRVFMLADTYRPSRSTEEQNLWYVAVTRAIATLFMVSELHVEAAPAAEAKPANDVAELDLVERKRRVRPATFRGALRTYSTRRSGGSLSLAVSRAG